MADSGKVIYMIKMKRIFAAASAVVMAAGVFASCGNADSSSKAEKCRKLPRYGKRRDA